MSPAEVAADFADDLSRVVEVARLVVAGHITDTEARWLLSDERSRLRLRNGESVDQMLNRLHQLEDAS